MTRLLIGWILVLGLPFLAQGHEVPDGEIDRRVQVSVKADSVLVQYSLAMSKATLKKQLRQHDTEPAATLPAMWKQYQKIILTSLHKHMRLTVDGKSSPIKPIKANYSGWSHLHLNCLLKAQIRLSPEPKNIVVTDANFLDAPGNYRIAMKGRSGAKMESSPVPSTTSRAKPIVLVKMSEPEKQTATRVEGKFSLAEQR